MLFFKKRRPKVGLALSGGGARGVSCIGVFKALNECGIKIDFVAGTSAGALGAVMYASQMDMLEFEKKANELTTKDIRSSKIPFLPTSTDKLQDLIRNTIKYENLEDLPIPCCVVTCDIIKAEEVDFTKGNIAKTVAGSCCMPGFFTPVEYKEYHLMDGGLINNIPANICRQHGCDIVIVVDFNSTRGYGTESVKTLDCLLAAMRILMKNNSVSGYANADIVIQPKLKQYKSTKLENAQELIDEGYHATMEKMIEIESLIAKGKKK